VCGVVLKAADGIMGRALNPPLAMHWTDAEVAHFPLQLRVHTLSVTHREHTPQLCACDAARAYKDQATQAGTGPRR
jgi:hypothetical protein